MQNLTDLTDQKFGEWKVIERAGSNKNRMRLWKCECSCGIIRNVTSHSLMNGRSKSCRCKNREATIERNRKYRLDHSIGDIETTFFAALKGNAKTKNKEFNISREYLWNLFLKQNKKCAITKVSIVFGYRKNKNWTASLDRIDNTKGYIEGNVRWVHKIINLMRGKLEDKEFQKWCQLVIDNKEFQIDKS